jgi:hypothetical protein
MNNPGRSRKGIFVASLLLLILACGGLAVFENMRFGPARDFVALNTAPSGGSDAGGNAATSVPVSPTRDVISRLDRVDPSKMIPPQNCGLGDRYAVVCKDGLVRKGYTAYSCEGHGGLDYYLICPRQ